MKRNKDFSWFLTACLAVLLATAPAVAQDDLYYETPSDNNTVADSEYEGSSVTKVFDDGDDYYDEDDDYAYEYSSRIRRFHNRNVVVYDYYDPFYTDMYFYDPFFSPGASIYVMNYNDYRRWNRWNRWNRNNVWGWNDPFAGCGYNNWGWNNGGGWGGGWNNVYVYNNYYYDPYWTWNGYNPYYTNHNSWSNNNYYYNNNNGNNNGGNYNPKTYTGVRRGGTSVNPGYAALPGSGRLKAVENAPQVERVGQSNGRKIVSDKEPAAQDRSGRPDAATTNPRPDAVRTPENSARQPREATTERPATRTENTSPANKERPARQDAETSPRPERTVEPRPNRSPETRATEPRPSRKNENEEARPTRRSENSGEARPSRSSGERQTESRPTRTESPSRNERSSSPSQERSSGNSGSSGRSSGSGSSSGKRGRD